MTKHLTLDALAKPLGIELGKQEMVLTDPSTLRAMLAKRCARAILTTIHEAGYRIVPLEATEHMIEVGHMHVDQGYDDLDEGLIWQAMIFAAPAIDETAQG